MMGIVTDVDKLAEKLMEELRYYMDGYYLNSGGDKDIQRFIADLIKQNIIHGR